MDKFKFFDDITSDVIFEAYGKDLKDVFSNAAEAMFHFICKIDQVEPKDEVRIEVGADSVEELMINWLQALIAEVDISEMFFCRFRILDISENKLTALAYGESITPVKGETLVKAVTYHQYAFEKTGAGYRVRVSLDI